MSTELEASRRATSVEQWIAEARGGDRPALGRLLGACFSYLLAAANRGLSAALRGRLDPSDVVQDTLMEAWQDFSQFRGKSEVDLLAWLRQILRHNLANEHRRHIRSAMRSTRREVALRSSRRGFGSSLATKQSHPRRGSRTGSGATRWGSPCGGCRSVIGKLSDCTRRKD
jgi:DNA-directed RNA polymerase specialized sigma24 family protein